MSTPRSVILIGLSGAGKTTVARLVAEMLDAPWADLDSLIAVRAGQSIEQIFVDHGEEHFRELERSEMAVLLDDAPRIIASGAGWAVQPGAIEFARAKALVIHLQVDPVVAARRLQGVADRPLLTGDLEGQLKAQLVEREAWYRRADQVIAAGADAPEVVAVAVAAAARQHGGWASH